MAQPWELVVIILMRKCQRPELLPDNPFRNLIYGGVFLWHSKIPPYSY